MSIGGGGGPGSGVFYLGGRVDFFANSGYNPFLGLGLSSLFYKERQLACLALLGPG